MTKPKAKTSDRTPAAFDPLSYAAENKKRTDEGRRWFSVDPSELYPAVLKEQGITGDQLRLALTPRDQFDDSTEADRQRLAFRAEILETARKWFTTKLHDKVGNKPMGLHITKDDAFRL